MALIVFSGLKDEILEKLENLPDPNVLASDTVEDLEAAHEQFREIANDLTVEETVEVQDISEVTERATGD